MNERLQQIAPELLRVLHRTKPDQLRAIRVAVCSAVVQRVGLDEPTINEALRVLGSSSDALPALRSAVEARVEQLDLDYFELQAAEDDGRATGDEVLNAFSRARAAAAVAIAIRGNDAETTGESVYEAAATTDDLSEIEELVDAVLSKAK